MIADLTRKNALVTGGGQGIGRGIALKLAEQGADVAIADINDSGAGEVVDEIRDMARKSFAVQIDVTSNDSVSAAIGQVIEDFGHLDILINNAGIGRVEGKAGGGLDEDWEENWNTRDGHQCSGRDALHQGGGWSFHGAKVRQDSQHRLRRRTRGPIWWGPPSGAPGYANAYGPSKAAVINYTQYCASTLGPAQH